MLKLVRSYLDNCTIGKVYYKGELIVYTIERPWLNNQKNISCIPAGIYGIEPFNSVKHPDCYLLRNHALSVGSDGLMQRKYCLIHIANFVEDINGCIGPGLKLHPSKWGVMDSRKAMVKLRGLIHVNNISKIEII